MIKILNTLEEIHSYAFCNVGIIVELQENINIHEFSIKIEAQILQIFDLNLNDNSSNQLIIYFGGNSENYIRKMKILLGRFSPKSELFYAKNGSSRRK